MELAVLFWIENFEERLRRIALVVCSDFVYLVEHHDRIARSAFLEGVDYPAGH